MAGEKEQLRAPRVARSVLDGMVPPAVHRSSRRLVKRPRRIDAQAPVVVVTHMVLYRGTGPPRRHLYPQMSVVPSRHPADHAGVTKCGMVDCGTPAAPAANCTFYSMTELPNLMAKELRSVSHCGLCVRANIKAQLPEGFLDASINWGLDTDGPTVQDDVPADSAPSQVVAESSSSSSEEDVSVDLASSEVEI